MEINKNKKKCMIIRGKDKSFKRKLEGEIIQQVI